MIAGDVDVGDHHRAGDLVLGLTVRAGLVADGARLINARTPNDVVIVQWPERAVKESLSGDPCPFASLLGGSLSRGQDAAGEALLHLLRGRSVSIGGSDGWNKWGCPLDRH
jgi:hypothetical protein